MIYKTTLTMASIYVLMALFLLLANGAGAVPVVEWNRTFGGAFWDESFYVAQTPDGGYITAGTTFLNVERDQQYAWLIKTDSEGQVQWNATYPAKYIVNISTRRDGGYIIRGVSNHSEFWLMKTDASGQEQWNRTLSVKNITYFINMEESSDGGSIVAAVEGTASTGIPVWWNSRLIKIDENGNEQWNVTFREPHEFEVRSVQATSDGGYILAGSAFLSYGSYLLPGIPIMDFGDSNALLIKTDANGNQQWEKTFGWWGEREGAKSVMQTGDGGYIIEGWKAGRLSDRIEDQNIWLIKTDASGNEQWNRVFGKTWGYFFPSIAQTSDRGYIFAGSTDNDIGEIHDWLIKTDANGNIRWKKVLDWTKTDTAEFKTGYSIKETSDSGYILAGSTGSSGEGKSDALLVKIRETGTSALETTEADIYGNKKSISGFEIPGAIVSMVILFLLIRKRN